jgi:CheY-like chemotaxis protein
MIFPGLILPNGRKGFEFELSMRVLPNPKSYTLAMSAEGILIATILFVEDDVFIRDLAVMMIDDLGHRTLAACSAADALAILRSSESIDAIITDLRLDDSASGGFEIARQAIHIRPQLRVLYVTGGPLTDEMRAQFVAGGQFLSKPYFEEQLRDALAALFAEPPPSLAPDRGLAA